MNPPIHCGVPAKLKVRLYGKKGKPHSIEQSFDCPKCGQIRLPVGNKFIPDNFDAIREEGIKFDESLTVR